MALNNVKAVGDDQAWKQEAERLIADLLSQVRILKAQVETLTKRVNG